MNNMDRCKEREERVPVSRLHELFFFNPTIGTIVWKEKGNGHFALQPAGGVDPDGYLRVVFDGAQTMLHRVAFAMAHGRWPDGGLDHLNQNKADNRIANLREASNAENMRNTGRRSDNTSGIKGVSWDKRSGKWVAKIEVWGKSRNLGHFAEIEHAAIVRRIAEHVFFGGVHAFPEDEGDLI